ncbi:TPA: hypothetical protein EYP38_03650, partial [Candidatus Micrarchaeota archaeon]|nr:hypothetical protein [Candidatus Micrarchaeota archaeon]
MFEPYVGSEVINQLNAIDPVAVSVGLLVLSFIVATIVLAILKLITMQVAKRTKTDLDDKLLEATQQPAFRIIIVFGLYLAIMNLGLKTDVVDIILKLLITIAYLIAIGFVVKLVHVIVNQGLSKLAD